ncbi:unnamed protein product, partial [Cuscuta epithymum]
MALLAQSLSHGVNVTQIVTIKLKAVEDYLTWRTQFESFLVSQGLFGIIDGSIQVPPMYTVNFNNQQIINTDYYHWLRVDQTIRSWLFATLTRNVLTDVHDIKHSAGIWNRLQTRFMSASLPRAMELKRTLNSIKKKDNQSMEQYLLDIKNLADALAAINSPVTNRELLQSTLYGLGPEYEFVVGTISMFPDEFPPDILEHRLLEAEQRVLRQRHQESTNLQQAFGAQTGPGQQGQPGQPHAYRGRGGRGRGARGRGGRGRGRNQHQPTYQLVPGDGQISYTAPGAAAVPGSSAAGGVYHPRPNNAQSGFPSAEGILGSVPPPVVCQICFSAGHSAIHCPSRFSQPSAPALVAPTGESNDVLWYPD